MVEEEPPSLSAVMAATKETEKEKDKAGMRPEDMIPLVREYLGLLDDKKKMDAEIKRLVDEIRKMKKKMEEKSRPIENRMKTVGDTIKKTILHHGLPGVKYNGFIFYLEKKPVFDNPAEKIARALENNPDHNNDKKTLARIIADALKKKTRKKNVEDAPENMDLKIRIING